MNLQKGILIDTHILLWYLNDDERLTAANRELLVNIQNNIYVSSISLWEISIKISLNKLTINISITEIEQWIRMLQFTLLPINTNTLEALKVLLFLHRDPFDRYLVAEAQTQNLQICSEDPNVNRYFENPIDSLPNPNA